MAPRDTLRYVDRSREEFPLLLDGAYDEGIVSSPFNSNYKIAVSAEHRLYVRLRLRRCGDLLT
jgi:hypothetical protein